jgi:hypothetical protein
MSDTIFVKSPTGSQRHARANETNLCYCNLSVDLLCLMSTLKSARLEHESINEFYSLKLSIPSIESSEDEGDHQRPPLHGRQLHDAHPRESSRLPHMHGTKHSIGTQNELPNGNMLGNEKARACSCTDDAAGLAETK